MRRIIFILVLSLLVITDSTLASSLGEYQIKAAYIYNFAKFIYWPDVSFTSETSPLIIGVLGKNTFKDKLIPLNKKTVHNRPLIIRYYKTPKEIDVCHLLYISPSESGKIELILKDLKNRPIVTVGDSKKFAQLGGIIQFVKKRDRLRFIINLNIAKKNNITIDSQLLSLATEVLR